MEVSTVRMALVEKADLEGAGLGLSEATAGDYFTLRYEVVRGELSSGTNTLWISARRERRPDSGSSEWQITSISLTEPTGP